MQLSAREKNLWIELFISISISLYYFISSYQLNNWTNLAGSEMAALVRNLFVMAIVTSIVLYSVFSRETEEYRDERDVLIEARGNTCAYYCLSGICILLVGYVFFKGTSTANLLISGPWVAHIILLALMLSGLVKTGTQLLGYRRGY